MLNVPENVHLDDLVLRGYNMLIIVEGVDGTGKSTLVNDLAERFYTPVRTAKGENRTYREYLNMEYSKEKFVMDRSFISDFVYRTVDDLDVDDIDLISGVSILEDCTVIYCDTKKSFKNSILRGEDNIVDKRTHNKIKQAYNVFMTIVEKFTKCNVIRYDFTKQSVNDLLKILEVQNAI